MDIARYDVRNYRTVSVLEGYGAWVATYEDTVLDIMDLRLLDRLNSVAWHDARLVADLACGTGRTGAWLKRHGVGEIDGVDLTPEMLEQASSKGVYRALHLGDIGDTQLPDRHYDLVTAVLVDEHLPTLVPLYSEAARISRPGGRFVLVGYHPYFLLNGIPTHFDAADGDPVSIQCFVHLFSDHVHAALNSGWVLREMFEGLVDEEWVVHKPSWQRYLHQPVSFAIVWQTESER